MRKNLVHRLRRLGWDGPAENAMLDEKQLSRLIERSRDLRVVRRDGWFRSVALFATAAEQSAALPRLQALSAHARGAYLRDFGQWCAGLADTGDVTICATPSPRPTPLGSFQGR